MMPPGIRKALDIASQLAEIASDWHLDEVEIDGEMVSIYDVKDKFDAALALLDTLPAAPAPDWEPISAMALQDGRNIVVDDIALTVAEGNTAMDTLVWPEDGYEYNLCRRVREEQP